VQEAVPKNPVRHAVHVKAPAANVQALQPTILPVTPVVAVAQGVQAVGAAAVPVTAYPVMHPVHVAVDPEIVQVPQPATAPVVVTEHE